MEENILSVGIKIEMTKPKNRIEDDTKQNVTYVSQIMDMDGEILTCAMPIYEGHLIPLETGSEYEVYFYAKKGIYKANCKITSRGKEGNIYICQLKVLTALQKFQRRQFFRLPCTLDVSITPLLEAEMLSYVRTRKMPDNLSNPIDKGMAVDISGGGMRIISDFKYDKGTYVCLDFLLNMPGIPVRMILMGQVIQSLTSETNNQLYDQRIQFREISRELQDDIIKFIFEEQRKIRKKQFE